MLDFTKSFVDRIVKNPMDLGTVRKRLGCGYYDDPSAFAEDVRLIWRNAILYNGKGHYVSKAAEHMSTKFEGSCLVCLTFFFVILRVLKTDIECY